jgi:hypothetical protein
MKVSFPLCHNFKILRQNKFRRSDWNFSDPMVDVIHLELSGRNGPLILNRWYIYFRQRRVLCEKLGNKCVKILNSGELIYRMHKTITGAK